MAQINQGDFIGKESIDKEYKEICLGNLELFFTREEIANFLLYNARLDHSRFNSMIASLLNSSIYKYLPKYIGNFSKAGISGNLFFGVTDDGIVEGIPWYGKLTEKNVRRMIRNVFESNRSRGVVYDELTKTITYDPEVVNWYYSNIQIIIHELKIDETGIGDSYIRSMKKLNLSIMKNKRKEKDWERFELIYSDWHRRSSRYSGKLNNYILDTQLFAEVIDFIHLEIKDKIVLNSVLRFYSNKSNFDDFITNNDKKIRSIYDNPTNPLIWIVRYKDSMCAYFKKIKPAKPVIRPTQNLLHNFANKISNIKSHLVISSEISSGKKLGFYVPEIIFPYKKNSYIEYLDGDKWCSRERTDGYRGPCCR